MTEKDAIRSQPTYSPLTFDAKGKFNLLIGCAQGIDALADMVIGAGETLDPSNTEILIGAGDYSDDANIFFGEKAYRNFDFLCSAEELLNAIPAVLDRMKMGMRLYVAGPEQFVWDVVAVAKDYGLLDEELHIEARGTYARRVTCSHCKANTENVITNIVDCAGCGLKLFVYDHFSRRLRAYMGFRVDAEVHGEFPAEVEVFR